jgi:protein-arginine kinase activator protein McsA
VLILPDKSIAVWKTFWDDNKVMVYKYVVKQVRNAIKNGDEKAVLFGFENNDVKIWIEKHKYVESLERALDTFVKEEEFEYAAKVRKIINEFLIDEVIRESINTKD